MEVKERFLAEISDKFQGDTYGGIPVFFILEPDGSIVADCFSPDGNIGGPVSEEEIAFFGEIMKKAAIRITAEEIEQLVKILTLHSEERFGR
ncbi:hypothetical protein ACFL6T_00460 [Candidatus Zixiibacteriota bacterium]